MNSNQFLDDKGIAAEKTLDKLSSMEYNLGNQLTDLINRGIYLS